MKGELVAENVPTVDAYKQDLRTRFEGKLGFDFMVKPSSNTTTSILLSESPIRTVVAPSHHSHSSAFVPLHSPMAAMGASPSAPSPQPGAPSPQPPPSPVPPS